MPSSYPATRDVFNVPNSPSTVNLSDAGSSSRNHVQHHQDLGDAVMALEANAALLTHDHSGGSGNYSTARLSQVNTHQAADTDSSVNSIHHTLGSGATQASPGNHTHAAGGGGGGTTTTIVSNPYFFASRTGNYSLANNSPQFMPFNSVQADTNTWWNQNTLQYVPKVAGVYLVHLWWFVYWTGGQVEFDVNLNGGTTDGQNMTAIANTTIGDRCFNISMVRCNGVNDSISGVFKQNTGGPISTGAFTIKIAKVA